jgi:glycosyltransferase 2 family protein
MGIRIIQIIVGLVCTVFFMVLALYRVRLGAVSAALANADPTWIAAAIVAYAANLALRARRWQIILRAVEPIPYGLVARALVVGYGLNTIMPARLGELFRAEFFKGTFGLSRVWALTSIVIERLFDGLTVVACLGIGLFLAGHTSGVLVDVLATGAAIFAVILVAALCLAGPTMSRVFARFPGLSAQIAMVQRGFGILRTWRMMEVVALTLTVYVPDALSLWCVVKAVGLALGLADTLVLVGAASLSTLVPSGPAFLGTLQFGCAMAIEFAGGPRALGIAAAALAQMCLFLPLAIVAAGVLIHGSGGLLLSLVAKRKSDDAPTGQ